MTDLNLVEVFKVTVPNIERHLLLKRQDHEDYAKKRKWEFKTEDSYLEYPVPNGDLALRVFQAFQKSIDPILEAAASLKVKKVDNESKSPKKVTMDQIMNEGEDPNPEVIPQGGNTMDEDLYNPEPRLDSFEV